MKHFDSSMLVLATLLLAPALAQGAVNQWTVTPGAAGAGGTVHVEISATVDITSCCCVSGLCMVNPPTAYLSVSPCPPGKTCSGDTYSTSYSAGATDTLSLRCGVQYAFLGSWEVRVGVLVWIGWPTVWSCSPVRNCGGAFAPTTFLDGATPASSASWGKLKLLYR